MVDLAALEERARDVLPPGAYDHLAGGADDELTLVDNVAAWSRIRVRPRVLRDVSRVVTAVNVLGTRVAAPVLVAPVGLQRLAHPRGEVATARGALAAGSLMIVSTRSSVAIEDLAEVTGPTGAWWFQLYVLRDRVWTEELVDRAVHAGASAIVMTVDTPFLGRRRRDEQSAFIFPGGVEMANLPVGARSPDPVDRVESGRQSPAVTFTDISWLADRSGLPVVVKGVLRGDDAAACVQAGASAVVVSNHGGRQADGVVATADVLAEVVDEVGDRAEVYVDGGVRRGTDVLKALALGARATLVGRPVLWGLACGGERGVTGVLGQLREELALAMALCGVPTVRAVSPDLVDGRRLVRSRAPEGMGPVVRPGQARLPGVRRAGRGKQGGAEGEEGGDGGEGVEADGSRAEAAAPDGGAVPVDMAAGADAASLPAGGDEDAARFPA